MSVLPSRVTVPTHSRPAVAMLPGRSTWSPTCWAAGAAGASPFQLATNLYCEKLQRERPGPAAVSSTRIFPAFSGPGRAPSPSATESARAGETGGTCRPAPAATAGDFDRQILANARGLGANVLRADLRILLEQKQRDDLSVSIAGSAVDFVDA